MADIFNRGGNDLKGTFSADGARVIFSGGGTPLAGGVGLLTQNIQGNYSQQVTRLYEVGSDGTFLVAGRTQGQVGMGRIMGPRPVQAAFYKNYGDVCNAPNNNLSLELTTGCQKPGQGGTGKYNVDLKSVVITTIGFSVAAADMMINEQLQALFISMDLKAS